jgi:O-antigen ligase
MLVQQRANVRNPWCDTDSDADADTDADLDAVIDPRLAFSRLSGAALYLLSLSLFLAPAGVAGGLVLLWVGFVGELAAAGGRRKGAVPAPRLHPLVWLTAVFVLYLLAQPMILGLLPTGGPVPDMGTTLDWARLAVFVPAGYAIAARPGRLPLLLLLALVGLIGGMLVRLDWALLLDDPANFIDSRSGFGFGALAFGLYSGTALLGLVLLRRRCWQDAAGRARWWRVLPWLIALAVVLQGLVMTKARGSWLALLAALVLGLWLARRGRPAAGAAGRGRRRAVVVMLAAAGVLGLVLFNGGRIAERFTEELDTARAMAAGEIAYDRTSSVSLRWHAHRFGLAAWAERPWLGWGAGTTRALMDASGNPAVRDPDDVPLKHQHNTYLELAVQLGLVGLLLFLGLHLGLMALVAARLRGAAGQGADRDILVFLLAGLVLLLVWDLFDYRAVRQDWRGHWTLLAGAALSLGLRPIGGRR